jgi:hypothetical protein
MPAVPLPTCTHRTLQGLPPPPSSPPRFPFAIRTGTTLLSPFLRSTKLCSRRSLLPRTRWPVNSLLPRFPSPLALPPCAQTHLIPFPHRESPPRPPEHRHTIVGFVWWVPCPSSRQNGITVPPPLSQYRWSATPSPEAPVPLGHRHSRRVVAEPSSCRAEPLGRNPTQESGQAVA